MDDDDDFLQELDKQKLSTSKPVRFKKKPIVKSAKIQRSKLSFDDEEEEEEDDELDTNEPPVKQPLFKSSRKSTKFVPVTRNKRDAISTKSSSPGIRDLSKYKSVESPTLHEQGKQEPQAIDLELDYENPENNPVIETPEGMTFDLDIINPPPKIFTPPSVSTFLVNDDTAPKQSLRQYVTAVANEYKDKFNYDDGVSKQDDFVPMEYENDNDFELGDEDAGQYVHEALVNRFVDKNMYDLEISEDELDVEGSATGIVNKVKVLLFDEQLKSMTEQVENLKLIQHRNKIQEEKLLEQKTELKRQRDSILTKLDTIL